MLQIRPATSEFSARLVEKPVYDPDGRHVATVVDVRGGRLYVDAEPGDADAPTDAPTDVGRFDGAGPHRLSSDAVARVTDDAVYLAD